MQATLNAINAAAALAVTYFASGSNHPGEILGFDDAGIDVGVAVNELRGNALDVLCSLAGTGRKVFVDSGAFGEIRFGAQGPYVHKAITAAEWTARLDAYETLSRALGSQVYVVAPDKVAFQAETLERLETYAWRIRKLRSLGANIIVPHQKGALSLSEFRAEAIEILGFSDFVVGIPAKKDATSTEDILALLVECQDIERIHLLGLGAKSRKFETTIAAMRAVAPGVEIFCDSVLITSLVGRTNGRGGGARPLTQAHDEALAQVNAAMFHDGAGSCDYTDAIGEPSCFLSHAGLCRFARAMVAAGVAQAMADVTADVDEWLQCDDNYLHPLVELELDALWANYLVAKGSVTWRKRTAISELFRPAAAAGTQHSLFDLAA